MKDNESVWAGVNYSNSTQTFDINNTKVEVKAKGMFILKKKDDNTYECSFYNPESTNSASDIESKISMTGYSITNKNTSTSNESGVHFELTNIARKSRHYTIFIVSRFYKYRHHSACNPQTTSPLISSRLFINRIFKDVHASIFLSFIT